MTVVCHAKICGIPTVISDLLITSTGAATHNVAIPVARDVNRFLTPADHAVVGMRQKVNVLGDRLAVLWSGSLAQAEDIVPSLRPLAAISDLSADLVRTVLSAVEPSRKSALSLIVLIADQCGSIELVLHNVSSPQRIGKIARVVIAGTGERTLLGVLRRLADAPMLQEPVDPELTSKGAALTIAGLMGGEELRSTKPLKERWGGSFELARFTAGRFSKLGKQLYLYFRITRSEGGFDLWWTPFLRKIDYWNDTLCVQAIQHEITSAKLLTPGRQDIFLLTPVGSDTPDLTEFTVPPIVDHAYVVTYVFGAPEDNDVLCHVAQWGGPLFSYNFSDSHVRIAWRPDFIPDLCSHLSERLGVTPTLQGIRY
jgi:hypothetical protein